VEVGDAGGGWVGDKKKDTSYRSYRKQTLFRSLVTWCSTTTHTYSHPTRCLYTQERFAWISFSCHSLITRCQTFSQPGIAWLQGRSWFAKMRLDTNVSCSVGQLTSILSYDPRIVPSQAAHLQHSCLAEGRRQKFINSAERTLTCWCEHL